MSFTAAQHAKDSLRTNERQPMAEDGGNPPRRLGTICSGIIARLSRQRAGRPQLRAIPNDPDQELCFDLAGDLTPAQAKLVIITLVRHRKIDGGAAMVALDALGLRGA